ncbi:ParA family protein [Kocuria sp.]|uniref:ParA family protein n=1 Tax=Kocuria sp. TaxID=1871328 RepID=UPI0028AC5360|nr:ParA family protein [Kocuria sp.]
MKIALLNSKGGCGKTTSAMFLAQVAANRGHVAEVWDSDPQASATRWAEAADLPFDVVPANIATMRRPVSDKYVFIDTPPGNPQILTAAAEAADLVIIPTMASMSDMDRTWATIDAYRRGTGCRVGHIGGDQHARIPRSCGNAGSRRNSRAAADPQEVHVPGSMGSNALTPLGLHRCTDYD